MDGIIFVPYPLEEESPTSVLKRFALGHGCEVPGQLQDFSYIINFNASQLTTLSPLVQWIASRAGEHAQRFLEGFYHSLVRQGIRGPLEINGTVIPSRFLRKKAAAFCSECWDEGHERYIKDLSLTECCPYHDRRYIHACPACHVQLLWISALEGRCVCGHVLVSKACSHDEVYAERYLLEAIRNQDSPALAKLRKLLSQLAYPHAPGTDPTDKRVILNAAVGIMQNQERYIIEYLFHQAHKYPHVPLAYILAKVPPTDEPAIKAAIERFSTNYGSNQSQPDLSSAEHPEFELSRAQLLRFVKRKYTMKELEQWAIQFDLPWPEASVRNISHRYFIPLLNRLNEASRAKPTEAPDHVGINAAASAACVTRNTMRHLINHSYLTEIRGPNRVILVRVSELEAFLQRYESGTALSLRLGKTLHDTLDLLKLFKIRPINHLKYSGSAVFEHEAICSLLDAQPEGSPTSKKKSYVTSAVESLTTTPQMGYCTISTAAKKLGVSYKNICTYINAGILSPYRNIDTCRIILKTRDVSRVAATYVLRAECRKILNLDYRLYSRHLIEMGVHPVTLGEANECTQPLFLRSDIETLAKALDEMPPDLISSHEASRRLNLSHPTVLRLIALGDLAPEHTTTKLQCASLDKVVNFHKTHVNGVEASEITNINVKFIRQILSKFGVKPICIPQKDYSNCLLYRLNELNERGVRIPCSGDTADTKWKHIKVIELISAHVLASDLGIPFQSFRMAFIRSGFIPSLRIHQNQYYISPKDAKKCRRILAHSMTPSMIDKRLNVPNIANYLRRNGLLERSTNIPNGLPQDLFISRASFDRLSETDYPRKNLF